MRTVALCFLLCGSKVVYNVAVWQLSRDGNFAWFSNVTHQDSLAKTFRASWRVVDAQLAEEMLDG